MIDFTCWYFLLKDCSKCTSFSNLTSFLSFFYLCNVTPMSSTYLDYLKDRYKSDKLLKITLILPILYQWCPLIWEKTVVSIHLLYHAGHMYQRGTCIYQVEIWYLFYIHTSQPAITCSKLTIETIEQGVKYTCSSVSIVNFEQVNAGSVSFENGVSNEWISLP